MAKIYSSASQVLVWLGDIEDTMRWPWSRFNQMRDQMTKEGWDFLRAWHEVFKDFQAVCNRRYWSRLWIVQEVLLPREVLILIGNLQIRLEDFIGFIVDTVSSICHLCPQSPVDTLALARASTLDMHLDRERYIDNIKVFREGNSALFVQQTFSLLDTMLDKVQFLTSLLTQLDEKSRDVLPARTFEWLFLYCALGRQCSDSRDSIYALLGMCQGTGIVADYTTTIPRLFWCALRVDSNWQCVIFGQNLCRRLNLETMSILELRSACPSGTELFISELPWVRLPGNVIQVLPWSAQDQLYVCTMDEEDQVFFSKAPMQESDPIYCLPETYICFFSDNQVVDSLSVVSLTGQDYRIAIRTDPEKLTQRLEHDRASLVDLLLRVLNDCEVLFKLSRVDWIERGPHQVELGATALMFAIHPALGGRIEFDPEAYDRTSLQTLLEEPDSRLTSRPGTTASTSANSTLKRKPNRTTSHLLGERNGQMRWQNVLRDRSYRSRQASEYGHNKSTATTSPLSNNHKVSRRSSKRSSNRRKR